jgi:predicted dehydrogenase
VSESETVPRSADRIGIGMVGAGQIARDRHMPGFKGIPGVELVGVVNRSAESSRRAAEEHGFRQTYPHWRELLADPEVDAVVIGTWPYLHAPITIAALDAGKHVLTQARMAMNAEQARRMLDASLAHPELVAMVVPSPFSLWIDRTIHRLLREGAIGELRGVRVLWTDRPMPGSRLHWRQQVELSGSNVMSLGIVYEAIARWLGQAVAVQAAAHVFDPVKERPDGSRAPVSVPDHLALVAEFPGPVFATLEMATGAAAEEKVVHLRGTGGTLRLDFAPPRLELTTDTPDGYRPVEVRPGDEGGWRVEEEFVDAIRGRGEVRLTDFATGAAYMAFTDAVRRSATEGGRIAIGPWR